MNFKHHIFIKPARPMLCKFFFKSPIAVSFIGNYYISCVCSLNNVEIFIKTLYNRMFATPSVKYKIIFKQRKFLKAFIKFFSYILMPIIFFVKRLSLSSLFNAYLMLLLYPLILWCFGTWVVLSVNG